MKTQRYRQFVVISESRQFSMFDAMQAEEDFLRAAENGHSFDCIPSNAREWAALSAQLDKCAELSKALRDGRVAEVAEKIVDSSSGKIKSVEKVVRNYIAPNYKKSMFEIYADLYALDKHWKIDGGQTRTARKILEDAGFPSKVTYENTEYLLIRAVEDRMEELTVVKDGVIEMNISNDNEIYMLGNILKTRNDIKEVRLEMTKSGIKMMNSWAASNLRKFHEIMEDRNWKLILSRKRKTDEFWFVHSALLKKGDRIEFNALTNIAYSTYKELKKELGKIQNLMIIDVPRTDTGRFLFHNYQKYNLYLVGFGEFRIHDTGVKKHTEDVEFLFNLCRKAKETGKRVEAKYNAEWYDQEMSGDATISAEFVGP